MPYHGEELRPAGTKRNISHVLPLHNIDSHSLYDFDLRATHARTLLPAALASVSFGFVLVRVRVRVFGEIIHEHFRD